jgi:hypothetical protein
LACVRVNWISASLGIDSSGSCRRIHAAIWRVPICRGVEVRRKV